MSIRPYIHNGVQVFIRNGMGIIYQKSKPCTIKQLLSNIKIKYM